MTSKHVDQVDQEKSPPTVPAHPLGDPTVAATRGDIWETSTLDGNSRETTATHGSFTRHLAKLAKLMFTHQGPYRDSEGSDPLDPHILGVPPGSNLATSGRSTQHLAAQGNFTRPLERYNKSLPAQGSAYHAIEGNLPYSTEGYLAVTTFGVTKEITANSQDPDQTSRRSRLSCRRVTRGHGEVTMENYRYTFTTNISPHHFLPLTISATVSPPFISPSISTTAMRSFRHQHLPYLPPLFNTLSQMIHPPPTCHIPLIIITSPHHSSPRAIKSIRHPPFLIHHVVITSLPHHIYHTTKTARKISLTTSPTISPSITIKTRISITP